MLLFKTREQKLRATTLKHFRDLTLPRFIPRKEVVDLKMTAGSGGGGEEKIEVVVAEDNKSKLSGLPDHFEGFPIVVVGR